MQRRAQPTTANNRPLLHPAINRPTPASPQVTPPFPEERVTGTEPALAAREAASRNAVTSENAHQGACCGDRPAIVPPKPVGIGEKLPFSRL